MPPKSPCLDTTLASCAVSSPSVGASLMLLTQRFVKMLDCAADGVLDLNIASWELNISKRCIYNIARALEGINLVKKKNNKVEWLGRQTNVSLNPELEALQDEEKKLDELIEGCMQHIYEMYGDVNMWKFAYVTYEDVQNIPSLKEQTVIAIKAPAGTKVEVAHPEQNLQVRVCSFFGPVHAFVCSDMDMESSTSTSLPDAHLVLPSCDSSLSRVSSKDDTDRTSEGNTASKPPSEMSANLPPVVTSASPLQDRESARCVVSSLPVCVRGEDDLSLVKDDSTTDVLSSDLEPDFL
ncbi:transcription factor E2F3 [Thalassophryne amazonica]|uniref:transcription factor E2F3 n=1 Tax=Thalassophryne amazonica TaxID=390379 RepID=UPI0014717EB1|nr:transcription factor E2F3 [Thalassophryne amazonica]